MGRKKKESAPKSENTEQVDGKIEYPFLREPAEPGGVIVCTDDAEATVQMTRADIDAANEEQAISAANLRTEQGNLKALIQDEKNAEAALKAAREALRKNEIRRLELGDELATFAEQIHTGLRKVTIKVVHTVTKGNELVITDARDGKERERRTATAEEIEWSTGKSTSLFAPPADPNNPQNRTVEISLLRDGFKTAGRKSLSMDMSAVTPEDADEDAEAYQIVWQAGAEGRSFAIVPFWVYNRLVKIAGSHIKMLDLRIEGGDKSDEVTGSMH